jgi:hypothetical protein
LPRGNTQVGDASNSALAMSIKERAPAHLLLSTSGMPAAD